VKRVLSKKVMAASAALALGLTGASVVLGSGVAGATGNGTLTLSPGTLALVAPTTLTWAGTLSGTALTLVDSTPADQNYTVNDNRGSGAGWHVTASATTFTTGTHSLADTGTFVNTGSTSAIGASTTPTAACVSVCTLPTNTTTFPVAITTAATTPIPVNIYDSALNTGLGNITIGVGANPVGWWVNVPATAFAGTYTSTVTLAVVTAP
jgi:hypothetical protein